MRLFAVAAALVACMVCARARLSSDLALALDLRGRWRQTGPLQNCENYTTGMARWMGEDKIGSMLPVIQAQMCAANARPIEVWVWQDCLELTITTSSAPVHHMILSGGYLTDDFHALGTRVQFYSTIEAPTPAEKLDGASAIAVSRTAADQSVIARRYVNSRGQMVLSEQLQPPGTAGVDSYMGTWVLNKIAAHDACPAYSQAQCAGRTYTHDTPSAWSLACCLRYGDQPYRAASPQRNPNQVGVLQYQHAIGASTMTMNPLALPAHDALRCPLILLPHHAHSMTIRANHVKRELLFVELIRSALSPSILLAHCISRRSFETPRHLEFDISSTQWHR